MTKHPASIALGALAMLATDLFAAEPTFDCAKVEGQVEALICGDSALAALDLKLAAAYDRALERVRRDGYEDPRVIQRGWIKGRNDCWKAEDMRACVETNYKQRIAELQIQYGDREVPSQVNYRCGDMDLAVVFYPETDPPTAVLTPIGSEDEGQVILFRSPSGSGAKYDGRNASFWEHQGEALLVWQQREMTCGAL
ncbi:MAG: MliC family protein [Thiohalocapsa sp.]